MESVAQTWYRVCIESVSSLSTAYRPQKMRWKSNPSDLWRIWLWLSNPSVAGSVGVGGGESHIVIPKEYNVAQK